MLRIRLYAFVEAIINSYALLFFSNNRVFALLLLVVSFFNPVAGLSGFCAVVIAVAIATFNNLPAAITRNGMYSYNALFIGIGMGTFYNPGVAFILLLLLSVLFSVILSAVLYNRFSKLGLPFLSLPFILCFWLILLVSKEFTAIDLSTRSIYWLNEMYAIGDDELVRFVLFMENLGIHPLIATFFRALSSIFFQNNILAGILIALGVLVHSRILFSLLVIGFLSAYSFNYFVKAYDEGINYYLLGVNFMMVSIAVGGFFVIPSIYSYIWAVVSVPLTFIMVIGLGKIMGLWLLPVYSLPFCITVLLLLYFFMLRVNKKTLVLTPLQFYSPEKNLYSYLNNKDRLLFRNYTRLQLPFLGEWMVSQGYDGSITHVGDYSKALDFIIVDNELKTFSGYGNIPENYYCYNKPVLAPADGYVQEIIEHIDDNEIGKINKEQNWGNSIVIKHGEGLFTKLSHLKKFSFKVRKGDYIKKGDMIATCGNSGRSPEPHLHFQVQATPFIASKTTAYPFSFYTSQLGNESLLKTNSVPEETELISNIETNENLKKAFAFIPGSRLTISANDYEDETWEVFTDAYNQLYIYCHETKAAAYFEVNEAFFYFISFIGNKKSLLYYFYVVAYKIFLSTGQVTTIADKFPLQLSTAGFIKWFQDIVAPFFIFSRLHYESKNISSGNDIFCSAITINSKQSLQFLHTSQLKAEGTIEVTDNRIVSFSFIKNSKTIKVTCISKD